MSNWICYKSSLTNIFWKTNVWFETNKQYIYVYIWYIIYTIYICMFEKVNHQTGWPNMVCIRVSITANLKFGSILYWLALVLKCEYKRQANTTVLIWWRNGMKTISALYGPLVGDPSANLRLTLCHSNTYIVGLKNVCRHYVAFIWVLIHYFEMKYTPSFVWT